MTTSMTAPMTAPMAEPLNRPTVSKGTRCMIKLHAVAWLLAGGLLGSSAHATRIDTDAAVEAPPQIVPALLLGRDTSAEAAAAKDDPRYGLADPAAPTQRGSGPMQQFGRFAASLAIVLDAPVAQADRKTRVDSGLEQLRAADLLVLAEFERIETLLRAQNAVGLSGALTRVSEARTRWQVLSAPVLQALSAAQSDPGNAVAQAAARSALAGVAVVSPQAAIYGNALPPVHRPRLLPRQPRMSPSVPPSYATATVVEPSPEDYAAGVEATLSAAIREKAASLDNNYVAIFDFVRSQVRTEWRAGSAQSVEETLRRGAGNDVEQASLLIALLRASMAPARYVTGVVEVPIADLASAIGVPTTRVGAALAAAGIPHEPVTSGGQLAAFRIDHVWVSTRVPYANYRGGVADTEEPTWVPLMPALKPSTFQLGTPVLQALAFDTGAWIDTFLATPQEGLPWQVLQARLASLLAAQTPPRALDALAGSHQLDAEPLGVLPASTPYRVLAVNGELAELLDEQRQWLDVRVRASDADSADVVLEQRIALASMSSRRLTLAYLPATVEDQQLAHQRGGLGGFPAYLVRLRPTLLVDGRPVGAGAGIVDAGATNRVELTLRAPGGELALSQTVIAGTLAALALDPSGGIVASDPAAGAPADSDTVAGRLLGRFAERYLQEWARADNESAAVFGQRLLRPLPSLVLALPQYRVEGAFGLVDRFVFDGVALDAAAHPVEPISLRAMDADEADWMRLSALHGSALEAHLFDQQWSVEALSADGALQLAAERGVPVLHLEPGDGIDALAAHASQVREHVALWLDRGYSVDIPRDPLTQQAWTGSGWRVTSPDGGDSGYFVSGVYAGGVTVIPPGLWYFQDLAGALGDPYALESNDDPLAGFLVQIEADAQYQIVTAGEWAELPLRAFVSDRYGMPVKGATVQFGVRAGSAELESPGGTGGMVSATTDHRGIASVRLRAPENNGGLDGGFLLQEGDTEYTRAFTTTVDLVVETREGPLTPGEPYFSYMVPGEAARIEVVPWLDSGVFQLPGLGFESFKVHAYDAFDNEVANHAIDFSVADQYVGPACAGNFGLPSSGVFLPFTDVCENLSIYAGCAPPSASGVTRHDGLHVNVVPSSIAQTRVTLTASSAAGSVSHDMLTVGTIEVEGGNCKIDDWASGMQWTYGEQHEVARPGDTIPFPRRFQYFGSAGGVGVVGPTWFPVQPTSTSLDISGGSAAGPRTISPGTLELDLIGGGSPSRISGSFDAVLPFPPMEPDDIFPPRIDFALLPAWTVDLPPPILEPDFLTLDAFQRSDHDLLIRAPLRPEEYNSAGITIEIIDDGGQHVAGCYHDVGNSESTCVIPRGTRFEPDRDYEARYVINSNFTHSLESDRTDVPFERGIVAGFGAIGTTETPPDLDVFVARKFPELVEIQTEIDTQTGYICTAGARFIYALGQDANVDITFYSLDEDGERWFEEWNPVNSEQRAEGVYTFDIAPDELEFGVYEYEIVATTDDDEETHVGRFVHREKRRGSLPLSHSFVKGVDVYDGHAVISAQDAAIGGRGPGLGFTRTYGSHSGDDKTTLGRGWQSDLESRVMHDSCGTYTVTGAAGQGQRYLASGVGPGGETIYRSANGFHGTLIPRDPGTYDFYAKDGTLYHYAEFGLDGTYLSYIEDTNGNRVTYEYGLSAGERVVKRMTDSAGRALNLKYEMLTLVREWSDDIEIRETRLFLTALDGPAGLHVEYEYDPDGNLARVVRGGAGGGQKIDAYAYEDKRGIWLQDPDGEFKYYHFGFRMTQARDEVTGAERDYTWVLGWIGVPLDGGSVLLIPEQRVETLTEPDGGVTRFAYQGLRGYGGTRTIVTDGRNVPTTYSMNAYGGAELVEAPNGDTTTVWDLVHLQPASVTDPLGTTTSYTYDEHGNKLTETVQHAHGTLERSWTYAAPDTFAVPIKDRAKTQTDARGIVTTMAYDARGNLTGSDRGGVGESFGVAANGDRTSHTNGAGDSVTYGYDAYGHPTEESDGLGLRRRASFDARGRMLSETDGNGAVTEYEYDALDRRIRTVLPATAAGAAEMTVEFQDGARKRIETDALHHATTFELDLMGRETGIVNALGKRRDMSYDENGNLLSETDFRGNTTTYVYDDANRVERKTEPEGKVTAFTHDALGNVLTQDVSRGGAAELRRTEFRYEHPLNLRTHERHLIGDTGWSETVTTYDDNGNAVIVTDPNLRITSNTYDARDRLERIDAPEGKVQMYAYDGADRRTSETLNTSPAQVRTWAYDVRGQETERVDGSGARWLTAYDLAGNVIRSTDPNGHATNYTYDARKQRVGERGPEAGQISAFEYDAGGNRILEATPDGRELVHAYDELNRRTSSTDQIGTVETLTHDDDGNVLTRTDAEGRVTTSTWNGLKQETDRVLPSAGGNTRELAFGYSVHGDVVSETDANGNTTTHVYNGLGLRTSSALPGGGARSWDYDAARNLVTSTDANGHATVLGYDGLDRKTSETDPSPLGTSQTWTYDAAGNAIMHIDRRGIATSARFDGENRVLEKVRDGLRQELNVYDGAGNLLTRTDANGEQATTAYDGANRKILETRPLQAVRRWTYAPWGGIETATDADGVVRSSTYDVRRRTLSDTDGAGNTTTYGYDGVGNRTRMTRPGSRLWTYQYDAADRLEEITSPGSDVTQYRYDAHGNKTSQRDAEGESTTLAFDERHRLERIDHPGGASESFGYDEETNRTRHTDANGRLITSEYDGLNRVTTHNYSGASGSDVATETWHYDGNGNIESIEQTEAGGGTHVTTRTWDRQERLASETDRHGQRTDYGYDALGNRVRLEDLAGTTVYQPNRLNQTARVTPSGGGAIVLEYTPEGRALRLQHPNGAIDEIQYDDAGRISRIEHYQGSVLVASVDYRYDERGNRSGETQVDASGTREIVYGYDDDDRLVQVDISGPEGSEQQVFTLDAVGNRLTEVVTRNSVVVVDRTYHYGPRHRLDRIDDEIGGDDAVYAYDDNGALISETVAGQTTGYRQNPQDRLAAFTPPSAAEVEYAYDADGRRVFKRSAAEEVRYGWAGTSLRRETNVANNPVATYDWGAGRVLRSWRGGETAYAQHDVLRSPVRWSRDDGGEQGSTRYDAWGNNAAQTGSVPPIGYTGHYKDAESGNYYAQQRYYAPKIGRFNRIDPWIGDEKMPITLNKYLYANGNPLLYTDPTGMYGEAGHYYTTYYIALRAGYSNEDAQTLAFYAQLPDEVDRLDAVAVQMDALGEQYTNDRMQEQAEQAGMAYEPTVVFARHRDTIQQSFHSLEPSGFGPDETRRTGRAIQRADSLATTGLLIHRLGDTFSHRKIGGNGEMYRTGFGHGGDGHTPDVIQRRPELYMDYVATLTAQLATKNGASRDEVVRLILEVQEELRPMAEIPTVTTYPMKPFKPQGWMQPAPPESRYRSPTPRSDGDLEERSVNKMVSLIQGIGGDVTYRPETYPSSLRDTLRYLPLFGQAKTLSGAIGDYTKPRSGIGSASYPEALRSIQDAVRLISANRDMQSSRDRIVEEDGDGGLRFREDED